MFLKDEYSKLKKKKQIVTAAELIAIFFSLAPYSLAVNALLVPHNIVGGGATGIAEIVYFASSGFIPLWLTTLTLNLVLLVVAVIILGWKFCFRTICGVLSLTFWLKVVPVFSEPVLHDPFMSCVVAGLVAGAGVGMVLLNGGSSGGTDIVAMIVNKYRRVSLGKTLFLCDLVIMSSAYLLPNVTIENVMMGLCFTFMMTVAVDTVMNHARQSVQFFIFSMYKSREIAEAINSDAHRGVTILHGIGGYSKKPMEVLVLLCKKHESNHIFDIIKEIDPNAFVSQTNAMGVYGKGFDTVLNKKEQERARQLELQFEEEAEQARRAHPAEDFVD